MMPVQKPGRSKQDYATPDEFIRAVKVRLAITDFRIDLAADSTNTKAPIFFDKYVDALQEDWAGVGWAWLNPPFADIAPWVRRACRESAGARIAVLVPASVGSNWFRDYVAGTCYVLFLNPRLSFDGKAPYPKDCMLLLYGTGLTGYGVWTWK